MKSLSLALLPLFLIAPALGAETPKPNPAQDSRLYDPKPMGSGQKFEKKPPEANSQTFVKPNSAAAPAAAPAPKGPVRVIPLTPAPSGTYEAPARSVTMPGAANEQAPGYLPLPSVPAAAENGAAANEPPVPADLASGSAKVEELPTGPITLYAAGNYRLRRGAWGRIQLIIPKGKTFQLLRKEGEWYVVSYNGKIGYVHERGITHPLAEAVRKQQGLNALRRNEAAEIAACLAQVKEPAQIPELEDVLKGIQSFIAKDSTEIIPPAPPTRPNRVNPAKTPPASRPPATIPGVNTPIAKTTPPTPPSADDPLLSPIKGRNCTTGGRRFGCYRHPILGRVRFHSGIDLQAPAGTPLVAPAEGCTLIDQRDEKKTGGYGHQVRLQCGSRVISYSHLSRFAPKKRQYAKGETVAYVGSTGLSSGPHLHLEVLEGGHRVDPAYAFGLNTFCPRVRPENKRATGCGRARNPIRQRSSR